MFSLANAIAYDGKMVIEPQRRIPSPLKVALTRAQQNFYLVGAAEVWREQPYFGADYAKLPLLPVHYVSQRTEHPKS